MENRKLIVKISCGLIAILIIVLVVLLVYQQRLIRQMSDNGQLTSPTETVSDSGARSGDEIQTAPVPGGDSDQLVKQLEGKIDSLEYHLEASEEELDMALEDLANARSGPPEDISEIMAERKKMLENPAVRKMERRMRENMIIENYGALFERLGLPDDKLKDFLALIVDNQIQMEEMSLDLMDQSLSEEERMEKMQQIGDQQNAELEEQVNDLLGAENYEKYDAYKRRLSERFVVTQFINPVGGNGGLSDEKEQELIDAMYEARKEVEAEYGTDSSDSPRLGIGVSVNNPEEDRDRQLAIYDRYVESARGVLSESQAEQFADTIKGMQEMTAMAAENLLSRSGGGDDESQ